MKQDRIDKCVEKIKLDHCTICEDRTTCPCPRVTAMLKTVVGSLQDLNAIIATLKSKL